MQERNLFKTVQEIYNIREVAEELGIRFTRKDRAWSIANNGAGEYAFAIYPQSNTWYDFMLQQGGDITDLVTVMKYNGDKKAALKYLMPDWTEGKIHDQLSKLDEFMNSNKYFNEQLFQRQGEGGAWSNVFKYLHARGITDETIKALQICLDFSNGTPRIRFPYWNRTGNRILYYTTRRYDMNGNGENEKQPKYMKASLDYHPYLDNAILGLNTLDRKDKDGNRRDYLIITEGMFDWLNCYQQGYSVISPNSCDFGKLWPKAIEAIRDFKYVILAFDNDDAGRDATYKAARELLKAKIPFKVATLLTKDVAEFCENGGKIESIVNSARDGKKWFIEYIRPQKPFEELTVGEREKAMSKCKEFIQQICPHTDSVDTHEIIMTLRQSFPKEWLSELFKIAKKGLTEEEVCNIIMHEYCLLFNEKTGFYEYNNGTWQRTDNTTIEGYIKNVYGRHATGGKLASTIRVLKATEGINSQIPLTTLNTQPCIAFSNGTLHIDLKTGNVTFTDHNKLDYVTAKMAYEYDPKADCVNWKKFINDVTNGNLGVQKLLQEFPGYGMIPTYQYHHALMLKGGGSNGKSVYTNIISALFGGTEKGYVSVIEPSRFSKDFRLMPLKNSWINISSETESDLRGAEGVFKKITSGDVIEDSYKHKDPIAFKTRTKLIMCCNNLPSVNDTSEGFMRRWLFVNFPMHYVDADKVKPNCNDRPKDPDLERKLMQELPGIFNWILEGLQRLLKQNQFTHTDEQDALKYEFLKVNNPLVTFFEDKRFLLYDKDFGKTIERGTLFAMYKEWADKHAVMPLPANRFYSNFSSTLMQIGIEHEICGLVWKFKDVESQVTEEISKALETLDEQPEKSKSEETVEHKQTSEYTKQDFEDMQQEIAEAYEQAENEMREFRRRTDYLEDPEEEMRRMDEGDEIDYWEEDDEDDEE